jgi:dihydroorotate dehydrogenase electron transfer subunit
MQSGNLKFDSRPKILPIKKIVKETENIWTFIFDYSEFSHFGASKPGQFVMLWIPGVDEKPFSIAYDDGKEFWLTIAKVGPATVELFKLKTGDLIGVRGPFGTHYEFVAGEHLALLAGGYGAAPMYNVACAALAVGCKVEFIVGARNKDLLLYEGRVKELAKKYKGKIKYHAATDDGSAGYKGYNTDVLAQVLKKKAGLWDGNVRGDKIDRVFACGPEIMMKKAAEMAVKAKTKCQISLERYMKCGFGVCGQCCMDDSGICVCKDGPVYDGAAALKLREFGRYHRDGVGRMVVR